jgi:hypothetical protein
MATTSWAALGRRLELRTPAAVAMPFTATGKIASDDLLGEQPERRL